MRGGSFVLFGVSVSSIRENVRQRFRLIWSPDAGPRQELPVADLRGSQVGNDFTKTNGPCEGLVKETDKKEEDLLAISAMKGTYSCFGFSFLLLKKTKMDYTSPDEVPKDVVLSQEEEKKGQKRKAMDFFTIDGSRPCLVSQWGKTNEKKTAGFGS